MPDLYETLGVPKDATQEQIQKAYRKKSKTAHPDGGGSEAEFAHLTKAKSVLLNPHHRSEYDRTGRTEFNPQDRDAQLVAIITQTLAAVIASEHDITRMSPFSMMEQHFTQEQVKLMQSKANLLRMKGRMETVIKRAQAKGGKDAPKILLAEVARTTIRAMEADLSGIEEKIALMQRAIEVVTSHTYSVDVSSFFVSSNTTGTVF